MKLINNPPEVKIDRLNFSESAYTKNDKRWDAATLVEWCKEKGYKEFDLPLAGIALNYLPFCVDTFEDFIWQMDRCTHSDLKYPIILDNLGVICDGYHRVAKAILEKRPSIKAIRIEEMPNPSGYKKETKE